MQIGEAINYWKKAAIKLVLHIFWIFPVDNRKITLLNDLSYTYGDSLKYIDIYINKTHKGVYKIVFPLKEGSIRPDNGEIIVKPMSMVFFKEMLTSRIIITNAGGVSYLPKRKGQLIINTWHGGGPYKKTSTDVYNNYWYRKEVRMNCRNTDYMLSSCSNFTEVEAKSMGFEKEQCIQSGLPRNDILFTDHADIVKKVKDHYSIPEDKKLVLFAPTFRSSNDKSTSKMIAGQIDLDIDMVVSALKERFGYEWVCGIRLHPRLSNEDISGLNVINCTTYPDMQELMCSADAVITDYSSLMWDYSFTYKPIFLYAPDIEEYEKERGFYMPVSKWPYPVAHDNHEMRRNILDFDEHSYVNRVKKHHRDCNSYEKGTACEAVCGLIGK